MSSVWLALHGLDNGAEHGVLESLRSKGLAIESLPRDERSGVGILLCGRADDLLLERVRDASREGRSRILVILLASTSGKTEDNWAWQLLQAGASDVTRWTESGDTPATHVTARIRRWLAVDEILASSLVEKNLVGKSRTWIAAMRATVEAARFSDAPILILGESGTGKELAASLVHTLDARSNKGELVVLDCTTIVPELSGSEFFGHERGAFTGSIGPRDGAFALADHGTLFLDEIGELPHKLQAQLLRVVQERAYKRVGGNGWHHTAFRLVCATNRDLAAEVSQGAFRRDLYHRLASVVVRLPPLRDRRSDIPLLVEHFMLSRGCARAPTLDAELSEYLQRREYPGNIRDLKQLVERMLCRHVGSGMMTVGDLPRDDCPLGAVADWRAGLFEEGVRQALARGAQLEEVGKAAKDIAVRITVNEEDGNLQRAAARLGVSDRALQQRYSRRAEAGQ